MISRIRLIRCGIILGVKFLVNFPSRIISNSLMNRFFTKLGLGLTVSVMVLGMPLMVSAQKATTTSGDRVQDGLNSIKDTYPSGLPQGTNSGTLSEAAKKIIDWALYLAAIVAVIFIIIGGYYYITARGNDEQAKQGRKTLTNALIGLAIVILSYLIVQIVYKFLVT